MRLVRSDAEYSPTVTESTGRGAQRNTGQQITPSWLGNTGLASGAQSVLSALTTQPPQPAPGHVMVTANWHASATMKLFFSAILLITLRVSAADWNSSERALHASPWLSLSPSFSPSPPCLYCPLENCNFFQWKHIIVRGWAVSAFTGPALLCVFHSNRVYWQDLTKQISIERQRRKKRCLSNVKRQPLFQANFSPRFLLCGETPRIINIFLKAFFWKPLSE